jgi:hypothetical protein
MTHPPGIRPCTSLKSSLYYYNFEINTKYQLIVISLFRELSIRLCRTNEGGNASRRGTALPFGVLVASLAQDVSPPRRRLLRACSHAASIPHAPPYHRFVSCTTSHVSCACRATRHTCVADLVILIGDVLPPHTCRRGVGRR